MKIKKLQIKNFKSLVDFELEDLKPFCAFVGPNASGKSNIFEALEFTNYLIKYQNEAPRFFGGIQNIFSYNPIEFRKSLEIESDGSYAFYFNVEFDDEITINFTPTFDERDNVVKVIGSYGYPAKNGVDSLSSFLIRDFTERRKFINKWTTAGNKYGFTYEQFADNFSRIFVGNRVLRRTPSTNTRLDQDGNNLPEIISAIFQDQNRRASFVEWLRILIPEFKRIEVKTSNIDGSNDFFIYEKGSERPFPKYLISDGTNNILSLMAAVFQTEEPQFLCIEEPENGLHPQAIELLVDFFREKCEEQGHHIWLNTHSQTLVRCLEIDEIILVNKTDGKTGAKQLTKDDEVDIKTDEAWLTNALGGGVLWSK